MVQRTHCKQPAISDRIAWRQPSGNHIVRCVPFWGVRISFVESGQDVEQMELRGVRFAEEVCPRKAPPPRRRDVSYGEPPS